MPSAYQHALIKALVDQNKILDRIVVYGDERRGQRRKILKRICANKEEYKEALKRALWLKHRVKDLLNLNKDLGITEEFRKEYYENVEYLRNVIYECDKRLRRRSGFKMRDVSDGSEGFPQGVF